MIAFVLIISVFLGSFLGDFSGFLSTSLIETSQQVAFTGTVSPIKTVPNWVELTDAERNMTYKQLPQNKLIPLPEYNLAVMKRGRNYNTATDYERNTFISYPVPFLGNYNLDATELSGAHIGTDIKIPIGTPIHAMANGIVTRVENQPTGYGKYVTITHTNVPDPKDPNQTTTLFSTYAHLSKQSVKKGQLVEKDQIIGYSGDTGFATAPHLHFQLDGADVPYAPWWPFTWAEVTAAGYKSFSEAVQKGLNKDIAKQLSHNPVVYVNAHTGFTGRDAGILLADNTPTNSQTLAAEAQVTQAQAEAVIEKSQGNANMPTVPEETPARYQQQNTKQKPLSPPIMPLPDTSQMVASVPKAETLVINEPHLSNKDIVPTSARFELAFEDANTFRPKEQNVFTVRLTDPDQITQNGITIQTSLRGLASVEPDFLTYQHFIDGKAKITVETNSNSPFRLIASGDFQDVESTVLKPVEFKDVPNNHSAKKAIMALQEKNIMKGYPDGTFKPDNRMTRAEAITLILRTQDNTPDSGYIPFVDVPADSWFAPYVAQAYNAGLLTLSDDKKFRPADVISRAEFLALAMRSVDAPVDPEQTRTIYQDVAREAWFASYFSLNTTYKILPVAGEYAKPIQNITRGDAAITVNNLINLDIRR